MLADPVVTGIQAWSRPSPFDAPATRQPDARCSAPGAGRSRSSTTARCRSPSRRRDVRSSCRPRSTACTSPTRRRARSGRRASVRVPRRGPVDGSRSPPREPSALQRLLGVRRQVWLGPMAATVPGAARGPDPPRLRALRRPFHRSGAVAREPRAASVGSAMTDPPASPTPRARPTTRRPPGRATAAASSSWAAPGAAARTCWPSSSPGTRAWRWSRSRSGSTSRSGAFRACSTDGSRRSSSCAACAGSGGRGFQTRRDARPLPLRARGAFERRPGDASRRPSTTTPRPPAGSSSSTCCGRGSSSPGAGRRWSSRAATRWPPAPTLVRLFPEAKFIHVVRDGRDASASRVAQTKGFVYPRTRRSGPRMVGGADPRDRRRGRGRSRPSACSP